MSETAPRKWRHLVVFILGTILSVGLGLYLAELFFPNSASTIIPRNSRFMKSFIRLTNWETGGHRPIYDASTRNITLLLNQSFEIEGLQIIYRGLSGRDLFEVDVMILAFDREMPFRYRISIGQAKEAFQLHGKKFKLISAKRNRFEFRSLAE